MSSKSRETLILWLFLLVGGLALVGYIFFASEEQNDSKRAAIEKVDDTKERELFDYTFATSHPEFPQFKDLQGNWLLMFIGYMTCPDVCPMSLAYVAREYKVWHKELPDIKVVFLSVDPTRDAMDSLKRYVEYFHSDFIAVRGEEEELPDFVHKLGGFYRYEDSTSKAGYLVTHSGAFYLVNPQGRVVKAIDETQLKGKLGQALKKYTKGVL